MIVQIGRREEFDKKLLGEMHKLRAQVFKERKGWDVSVIDEMEIDGYDALSPYYMLIQEDTPEAQVFGCWLRESEINQEGKARKLWDIEEGKGI